ncbi:hypothetical protein ASF33_06775 [Methylobacterium sp. Leaf92]|uniref:hypothetical protein n=1 Tax=Methylorubrum extorquens TaxID=408 RepID=UPI0006F8D9D7|nr:hypothetical protein [Methylorubrum extorquens]KQO99330.1 hypothetical protein ASF33_06775 [Methylobacterium sp. Leaf92]UYW27474.1 hypothetical protein OKC48_02730 [Methylorubrum extorquens]
MPQSAKAEFARYTFVVYAPPEPGLPWLSVCIGPNGRVFDSEALATFEEADLVIHRAQEILLDSLVQRGQVGRTFAAKSGFH